MSSYFDYYCKNIKNYSRHETEKIQGTCYSMCPQDEICLREKEKLVHVLEVVGNERRLVKGYSRSAADSNMVVPHHLRPYSVLKDTEEYLLFQVSKRSDVPLSIVYEFINDRLRAIRQDMTIQRLSPDECAHLLEPMARFHVYFGYRLNGLPLKDYDPVLNKKYLLECVKWFLSCCDSLEPCHNMKLDELSNALIELNINEKKAHDYDRVLIESLYILCNLDDVHPLYRYVGLSKDLKMDPRLQLSYKIAVANLKGNFVKVTKMLDRLCPLAYCALCLYLPVLQRRGLAVLSHAYSSQHLSVPSSMLRRWLSFTSDWEARGVCQHYGLYVQGSNVLFKKGDFKDDAPMHVPKIQFLYDGRQNLDIDHIFTYDH